MLLYLGLSNTIQSCSSDVDKVHNDRGQRPLRPPDPGNECQKWRTQQTLFESGGDAVNKHLQQTCCWKTRKADCRDYDAGRLSK